MPATIDLRRELRDAYTATAEPKLVCIPKLLFLAVDGRGAASSKEFPEAVEALFAASYGVKRRLRELSGVQGPPVMPLEALWSRKLEDPGQFDWSWTVMIAQPQEVTAELAGEAVAAAAARRVLPAAGLVHLETFDEGESVQLLHVGPYAGEGPKVRALLDYAAALGLVVRGRHHEIYLGDPHRVPPERLRTILRQPVERPAEPPML